MRSPAKSAKSLLFLLPVGWLAAGCHQSPPTVVAPAEAVKLVKTGNEASRRNVKTAIDPDASKIDPTPKDISVDQIVAQKPPAGKLTARVAPFETTTWRVKATLASIKLMKDGDYYLVLKGDKSGETVVEVPDPKECKGSPLEPKIAEARKELEDRYHPTTTLQKLSDHATVTGVGFLGFGPGKKGAKGKTGARLMPGLSFDFGKTS